MSGSGTFSEIRLLPQKRVFGDLIDETGSWERLLRQEPGRPLLRPHFTGNERFVGLFDLLLSNHRAFGWAGWSEMQSGVLSDSDVGFPGKRFRHEKNRV